MIDVPRICLYIVGEQYGYKVVCICGLTPQDVVIEQTEEWMHVRGATYLASHMSLPLGVVTGNP